ncbi:MAG: asparaginase [Armatimonadetes bacterium]|nr:asparaginase [Armatimonadota bacterium]MDW8121075.1 asparaginase [Armatimonadota bacterium]
MGPIEVVVIRHHTIEAVHKVFAVALEKNKEVAVFGDGDWMTYWRSTAKPFQAIAVVASGAADEFGLSDEELAIACGSHSGSAYHIGVVKTLLDKSGLTVEHLKCTPHEPFDRHEAIRLCREGKDPSPLHSNCSGKHSAMLAAAKKMGCNLEDYTSPSHPVQLLILQALTEATGDQKVKETVVSDGCGAPIWANRLKDIAKAFQRFAMGDFSFGAASQRLFLAMVAHPEMVAAKGHWNTRIIEALRGRFAGKGGAEGLFAGGFSDGRAFAVKVLDGQHRATPIATIALLKWLGWFSKEEEEALEDLAQPPVKTLAGVTVGTMRAVFP